MCEDCWWKGPRFCDDSAFYRCFAPQLAVIAFVAGSYSANRSFPYIGGEVAEWKLPDIWCVFIKRQSVKCRQSGQCCQSAKCCQSGVWLARVARYTSVTGSGVCCRQPSSRQLSTDCESSIVKGVKSGQVSLALGRETEALTKCLASQSRA